MAGLNVRPGIKPDATPSRSHRSGSSPSLWFRQTEGMDRVQAPHRGQAKPTSECPNDCDEQRGDCSGQGFHIEQSPIASAINKANTEIKNLGGTFREEAAKSNAEDSLANLSAVFAAADFDDAMAVRTRMKGFRRRHEVFLIPERETGLRLIESKFVSRWNSVIMSQLTPQVFTAAIRRRNLFFISPPSALLPKLAFEPSKIQERGWLLIFNTILSTAVALSEVPDTKLSHGLMWNTWTVLEDSAVFLKPTEVKIQALLLIAAHGQEISTPSLCWTLVCHTCRRAQSLALHLPTDTAPVGSESHLERICQFWALFVIDKSISSSFGRPAFLPVHLYENVPIPSSESLANYRPHNSIKSTLLSGTSGISDPGGFATAHFFQSRSLAIIHGKIQDAMHDKVHLDLMILATLENELDSWLESTKTVLYRHLRLSTCAEENTAVQLGINALIFQYHCSIVYVTRGCNAKQSKCIQSARSALGLLSQLVSSSAQVFNGIIWQLLYQPFMPYFVVFGNILSNPQASYCFDDLQLLHQVVLFFLRMHNNHQSAKKLERFADSFTRFAEAYVRYSMQSSRKEGVNFTPIDRFINLRSRDDPDNFSISVNVDAVTPVEIPTDAAAAIPSATHNSSWQGTQSQLDFSNLDSDPITLLNFFSNSGLSNPMATECVVGDDLSHITTTNYTRGSLFPSSPLFGDTTGSTKHSTIASSFDWFSWDYDDATMS